MKIFGIAILWLLTAAITLLISLNSLFTRQRMSHENGLVARGRIRVVDNPDLPPCDFFRPGREFSCRLRHATVSFDDDARLAARSASLKFDDSDHESHLDIKMNTGTAGPFATASDFLQFMIATMKGRETHIKPYLDKNPLLVDGLRGAVCYPETFALLNYHSKTPLSYTDKTGKAWYIKFKLTPHDRGPDRGRPTEEELEEFWLQKVRPGETRPKNYLKDEYRQRLSREPVSYYLQAQFHEAQEGQSRDVLNCAVPWDESKCPWLDLAEVQTTEIMATEAGNETWYDLRNHPPCMDVPKAYSINDPASINHLRMHDIWAKRARMLGYKWRGQLPPNEDARVKNFGRLDIICLSQDEPESSQELRRDEIMTQQQIYEFETVSGQPHYVKRLPECEELSAGTSRRMIKDFGIGICNALISKFELLATRRTKISVFDRYYPLWEEPSVSQRFMSDLEFGRQRLNGVNPILIKLCTTIPENFPVTEDIVSGLLDSGDTLKKALKAGRIYLLDHEAIGGIKASNGFSAAPLSLFYSNGEGQLLPLAIQLEQRPGPRAPIFTPNDSFWLWMTVKAYVQAADASFHEVASHLLRTHMVMETFAVAMHRRLHPRHPVFQLLQPHFHATMGINHSARTIMLASGGPIDKTLSLGYSGSLELLAKEYAKWDFSMCDLPLELASRGVDDESKLPSYHYREDGLLIWAAIGAYVGRVLDYWYDGDSAVVADNELQAWFSELVSAAGGGVRGLPEGGSVSTIENLKAVLTRIVFTCTAEHSSVNNGQYDMFGYPPNVPGSMYKHWPTDKEDPLSEQDFISRLPDHSKCAAQMEMVHLLSQPTRWMIGDLEKPYFHGVPEMWNAVREFRDELQLISNQIRERNKGLEVPYIYLDPAQISESIAI
jgi:hypothetical protein